MWPDSDPTRAVVPSRSVSVVRPLLRTRAGLCTREPSLRCAVDPSIRCRESEAFCSLVYTYVWMRTRRSGWPSSCMYAGFRMHPRPWRCWEKPRQGRRAADVAGDSRMHPRACVGGRTDGSGEDLECAGREQTRPFQEMRPELPIEETGHRERPQALGVRYAPDVHG